MNQYYIPWREGMHPGAYGGPNIKAKLAAVPAFKRVREVNQFGWSNQPKVFALSTELDLREANRALKATGLGEYYAWFPSLMKKDW